eukprot:scaffold14086_cov131-Isochrysis_galbana.AAC.2
MEKTADATGGRYFNFNRGWSCLPARSSGVVAGSGEILRMSNANVMKMSLASGGSRPLRLSVARGHRPPVVVTRGQSPPSSDWRAAPESRTATRKSYLYLEYTLLLYNTTP